MKWIINPYIIDKIRGTKFTILQFPVKYFNEMFSHAPNVYQTTESIRLSVSDIVTPTLILPQRVLISMRSIDPEEIPCVYIRKSYKYDSDDVGTDITPDDGYVTMVTFETDPNSETIKAYMLFIQQEDDKPNMPDTRIAGLIQVKTEYSFDTDKLALEHPYRVRFLQNINIWGVDFKYNDEIYAILSSKNKKSLKFATAGGVFYETKPAMPFELKPDMKFELDKLV
jgi:hypothetical protein